MAHPIYIYIYIYIYIHTIALYRYPETVIRLSYATLKSTLYRERIKLRPSLPNNMGTFAANLSTYIPLERFYKGSVTCSDGKKALIFTSNELLQELQKSTEFYVDGTFNVSSYIKVYHYYVSVYLNK